MASRWRTDRIRSVRLIREAIEAANVPCFRQGASSFLQVSAYHFTAIVNSRSFLETIEGNSLLGFGSFAESV
jgi:hypothetical protein